MGRTPVRFERVAAAFDADVARVRLCNSSENEQHSPEDSADLSDLVKSFMERGGEGEDAVGVRSDDGVENFDSEKREILEGIFDDDDGDAKEKIRREVQLAWGLVAEKDNSSPQFKQQLMSLLRYRGFDAGQYYTIYLNYSYQLSYSIFHFVYSTLTGLYLRFVGLVINVCHMCH